MKRDSPQEKAPRSSYRTMRERLRILAELEDWLEGPMQWLGLLWLVLVVIDLVGPSNRILEWLTAGLWVIFLLDFLIRFTLAPQKIDYLKHNVLTATSLVVPALRMLRLTTLIPVLRAARGLKLARLVGGVNRTMFSLRSLTTGSGFQYVLLLTVIVILVGAAGIYAFEKDVAGERGIKDFGTALWWSSMMITTMGSDYWPRSPEGRILTFLLALYAFAIFGYVTATIAKFFIGRDRAETASPEQFGKLERNVSRSSDNLVKHRTIDIAGMNIFYREAGPQDAPVILLPHGYPASSFQFRRFITALSDRWRLIAPDYPGFGYSDTPDGFDYSFDGFADFLDRFVDRLMVKRYVLYLHDFGSPIGARLAIKAPERVAALIIQNGDSPYEDAMGPKYEDIKATWTLPASETREKLRQVVSEEGFREEFLNEVSSELSERIPPDLWKLHWSLMTPKRREIAVDLIAGLKDNRAWFPRYRAYLREHQPPTLIVWGPQDGYMPEDSARAYVRDLPHAELHLVDGGHWALETNLDEIVSLARDFLGRLPEPHDT